MGKKTDMRVELLVLALKQMVEEHGYSQNEISKTADVYNISRYLYGALI